MEKRDKTQTLYPNQKGFTPEKQPKIGGTVLGKDSIEYNVGRESISLTIRNTGDRPIQVGSHYHLFEVNRFLDFDREAAFGMHLNIPSTTAIRFEPGDSKQVEAVAYGGKRRVIGFNSLVEGYAGEEDAPTYYPTRERAIRRMQRLGFKHTKSKQSNKQNKE
ncbi:MAG: urease subunit beta [Alistipes sp.]|nr:urease subunit beta [Alistipes sp.]MBR3793656.1 urease subunit beta [Alistipes sp.]